MSTHISAQPGQIAPKVLMPGDPLRAKYIAEKFLADPVCINEIRGMYPLPDDLHDRALPGL